MIVTISHSSAARRTACKSALMSSRARGYLIGAPPHSRTKLASTVELKSITAPGLVSSPGWINSSPVGIMPTLGRLLTDTVVCPAANSAPKS